MMNSFVSYSFHLDDDSLNGFVVIFAIHKISGAEFLGHRLFSKFEIDFCDREGSVDLPGDGGFDFHGVGHEVPWVFVGRKLTT